MRISKLIVLPFFSCLLFGQIGGVIGPLPPQQGIPVELRRYLELTPSQEEAVLKLVTDYDRMTMEKQQRLAQVQAEIAEEMRKESLDTVAIGQRYVEMEVVRRFVNDELTRMREKAGALMTAAQKTRLKGLEEALRLTSIAAQAQCYGLLVPEVLQPSPWFNAGNFAFQRTSLIPGSYGYSSAGCYQYYYPAVPTQIREAQR